MPGAPTAGWPGPRRLVVEPLHRAEQIAQQTFLLIRQRAAVERAERLIHEIAAARAAEELAADGLHHVLGQDAAHHRHLHAVRRIVEEIERGPGAAAEERRAGGLAEAGRDDHGDGDLPFPHLLARVRLGGRRHDQVPVGRGVRDDRLRDGTAVVIDDGDRDARGLGRSAAREDRSEERRDGDRHDERHEHGAPVAEEELQILADHSDDGGQHQSRRLLPVSDRNTVSSEARCPLAMGRRAWRPDSVSSAITLP